MKTSIDQEDFDDYDDPYDFEILEVDWEKEFWKEESENYGTD